MNNRKGFTLVELLIVVVILGIITAISLPVIHNATVNNEKKQFAIYKDTLKSSAKLYLDSYEADIFGRRKGGCYILRYSELERRNLAKDIQYRNTTCANEETFVKIVKVDDSYGYSVSLLCKSNGKTTFNESFSSDLCSSTGSIINIDAKTTATGVTKSKNFNVTITSPTGILSGYDLDYGFSTTNNVANLQLINGYKKLIFSIDGEYKQKENIKKGQTISTTTQVPTPTNIAKSIYLVIKVNDLRDINGEDWKPSDGSNNKIIFFGPYDVDSIPPVSTISVVSSNNTYNTNTPILRVNATDEGPTNNKLKMCISYETDTCKKSVSDIKKGTGYVDLVAEKSLSYNYTNPHNHKIYVTIADLAGNYVTKNANYNVAYQVTYHSNYPTDKTSTSYCNVGSDCTLTANTFTRTGYVFNGWNTKADGTGTNYSNKQVVTSANMKDLVLYAKWKSNVVTIQYNANGGTMADAHGAAYTLDGEGFVLKNSSRNFHTVDYVGKLGTDGLYNVTNSSHINIVKTGYKAKAKAEWNTKTNGSGKSFDQSAVYNASEFCNADSKDCVAVLYVNWEAQVYTITLDNKGASTAGTTKIYVRYNDAYYLNNLSNKMTTTANGISTPSKTGYTFGGYYTKENGKGTQYIDANGKLTSNANAKAFTANGNLYAYWIAKSATVTFNCNGGTGGGTQTFYYGTANQKFTVTCQKANHKQTAWTTKADGSGSSYNVDSGVADSWILNNVNGVTLYAKWKPLQTVWKFDYTGGAQSFTLEPGTYLFELWGAGSKRSDKNDYDKVAGYGAYISAKMTLKNTTTLYAYVGGNGDKDSGGWNGGGTNNAATCRGGGATDIRTTNGAWNNNTGLLSRIIVAGGSGGCGEVNSKPGYGGIYEGGNGEQRGASRYGHGGTQTDGGVGCKISALTGNKGGFGYGGDSNAACGGGGGGGWYGGGSAIHQEPGGTNIHCGAGGGSSYANHANDNFKYPDNYKHKDSTYTFTLVDTKTGGDAFDHLNNKVSRSGANRYNGYIIITYVS